MKKALIILPNSINRFGVIPMFFCFMFFLLCLMDSFPKIDFIWLFLCILSFFLSKYFYDTANIAIVFEDSGVHIVGMRTEILCFKSWSELKYAIYFRSIKGHNYLALTNIKLSKEQIKKYTILTKESNLKIKDGFVFCIDKNITAINRIINEKCIVVDYR